MTMRWFNKLRVVAALSALGMLVPFTESRATLLQVSGGVDAIPDGVDVGARYADQTTTGFSVSGAAAGSGGSSSSSADLATGEIRAFAHGLAFPQDYLGPGSLPFGLDAVANAGLQEGIHIVGDLSEPASALLTYELHGTLIAGNELLQPLPTFALVQIDIGSSHVQYQFQTRDCALESPASLICVSGPTFDITGELPFVIDDAMRDFAIYAVLSAVGTAGGIADFANTASLGLVLPAGLSFTSDSGVFLSRSAPDSVPEPGSLSLLGGGIAVGALAWRRRKSTAVRGAAAG
jgi:hypothetical protein